jgi:hypothetical protein
MARTRHLTVIGGLAALALSASALALPATAEDGTTTFAPQLVTVDVPHGAARDKLEQLGLDQTEHAGHDFVEVVLHTAADEDALRDAGMTWDVRIPDLIAREAEIARLDRQYAAATDVSPLPSGRDGYRTLADYNADMDRLATEHPTLVKKLTLPRPSLDGRAIRGIEIGSDVTQPETGRPVFALFGLHHAREWPSGELAIEFAFDLVKNYGTDPRITGLLDKARVVVVPVVNADGFHLSRTAGEYIDLRSLNESDPLDGQTSILATPGHAYMRKNCRLVDNVDTVDGTCAANVTTNGGAMLGVDLNRNYGGFWGGPGTSATLPNAENGDLWETAGLLSPIYHGAAPFSEPETQNIRDLIAGRQVTTMISNHTFSNLVLRPNGVNPTTIGPDGLPMGDAPDEEAMKDLGARMTAQNGYANIHGWQLYDTTGTTEDWSYNATGGYGFTFEIGPDEFHPPYAEVVDEYVGAGQYAGKGNREAYLIALENAVDTAHHSVLSGKAPAGATLRLKKTFRTPTWEGSYADGVESTMTVPSTGRFTWHVNPSTRPVVMSKTYSRIAEAPYESETITGTPATVGSSSEHTVTLAAPVDLWRIDLAWDLPDDLDMVVWRVGADGSRTEVGGSGNTPGSPEQVDVHHAEAGTYVIEVINYASASPSYTITSSKYAAETATTQGTTETYTLTCERAGVPLALKQVYVARGGQVSVDLAKACRL